jgi:hypothetical protein
MLINNKQKLIQQMADFFEIELDELVESFFDENIRHKISVIVEERKVDLKDRIEEELDSQGLDEL